jgi:secondary thiamine-phosphate synthase enzyme
MKFYTETITVKTSSYNELKNISYNVIEVINNSKITTGTVTLFVPHTTAAVTINENADDNVKLDFLLGLNKISPNREEYLHEEGNSNAHIKSSLIGATETILFENKQLILGIWQGIYFCEFDGPRERKLVIRVYGE